MKSTKTYGRMKDILLAGTILSGIALAAPAMAQDANTEEEKGSVVIVTGTRISSPGVRSASPITSIGGTELTMQQVAEPEKLLRALPSTIPGDGENVNNGTAGVTSINLRGLGANRTLVLMDGKRMTPYNFNGVVDVSSIPQAFIERIDILTGGATTVYGSDAMSGVVNFILKRDFEGVEIDAKHSRTGVNDGPITTVSMSLGANLEDGRGNVAMSMNWTNRDPVTLAQRAFGLVGVDTASGAGLDGVAPPAPAGCGGPNSVAVGGSTTTVPTRMTYMGGGGQFREDSTLGTNCGVFNFNPYNYYQTPQERFSVTSMGHYAINDHVEAYARATFAATNVRQQIAPSGVFGNLFMVPLMNPYLTAQARAKIISEAEAFRAGGGATAGRWVDVNGNGIVDAADTLQMSIRRRTGELGERSTTYDNNTFQLVLGFTGELANSWTWDVSAQMGQADRSNVSAGYTNVTNVQNALDATSTTACANGDSACVPIDLFGGFGDITPAMARYAGAVAIEKQNYIQTLFNFNVGGPIEGVQFPWAAEPVAVSMGYEYRNEKAESTPDECLKTPPTSCLGGAGGNTLPVAGGFHVSEVFGEASIPLVADHTLMRNVNLELGYRHAKYNVSGINTTWKAGLDWALTDDFRVRMMRQRAARAPNVGELFSPLVTGLRNAALDPCSVAQPLAQRNATLQARCVSTGMVASQVWTVQDIVAGQVGTFEGSSTSSLPTPEKGDTTTIGFVWRPQLGDFFKGTTVTLDYYDIKIQDYIGILSPNEVLDGCYTLGNAASCALVVRINGDIATPGAGVKLYTTNLDYNRATGYDLGLSTGFDLESLGFDSKWGSIRMTYNATLQTANESQSSSTADVLDCLGVYDASCDPVHEFRSVQRTVWQVGDWQFSYLWRHASELNYRPDPNTGVVDAAGDVFDAFEHIDAHDYIDLAASWDVSDWMTATFSVANVFDKDPPIIGNETGTTSYNSGNTFPSNFDTLGRVYAVGVNMKF